MLPSSSERPKLVQVFVEVLSIVYEIRKNFDKAGLRKWRRGYAS
jgi:hypothetical protein